MAWYMNSETSTYHLDGLLEQDSLKEISLDKAALLIAESHCGDVHTEKVLGEIDRFASEARTEAEPCSTQEGLLNALRYVLFKKYGFEGNREDYYNPDNSFLHRVVETRKGIPITLSLLTIEVGRRLGVELSGIGLPCHFMVGYPTPVGTRYFDPYFGGIERSRGECVEYVRELTGGSLQVSPEHFRPVSKRVFLSRMLNNLWCIYRQRQDLIKLYCILLQLIALNPGDPSLHLEVADVLSRLGNPWEAHTHISIYSRMNPSPNGCRRFREKLRRIQKRLAILN